MAKTGTRASDKKKYTKQRVNAINSGSPQADKIGNKLLGVTSKQAKKDPTGMNQLQYVNDRMYSGTEKETAMRKKGVVSPASKNKTGLGGHRGS
jgi:hypothetical protein